jgi:hypothetical protein
MKFLFISGAFAITSFFSPRLLPQTKKAVTALLKPRSLAHKPASRKLFLDVHRLGPGKVSYASVIKAHARDLATQKKYDVRFINYWIDTAGGNMYCLSSAADTQSIQKTHREAHGLLANEFYQVTDGPQAPTTNEKNFFLDVHLFGPGKVSAKDVAGIHPKDLATQQKYGVNFINYWVDEKKGVVVCLSQAKDPSDIIKTHREAHGLLPAYMVKVKQPK